MRKRKLILTGVCMIGLVTTACSPGRPTDTLRSLADSQKCSLETWSKELQCITEEKKSLRFVPNSENESPSERLNIESIEVLPPEEYLIESFPILNQMPELPTGCEITALTMALNYYGYEMDKVTMATQYLPCVSANLHYGNDGVLYGSDLNEYFVGDPTTELGYICGTGAIVTAADSYLADAGSELHAEDMTGAEPEELYELVSENIPVVVWVTIGMADRQAAQGWYTEQGEYVDWSRNDHGAVLIGYSEDTVTIADPISGLMEYEKDQFERVFESRGNQSVIIR